MRQSMMKLCLSASAASLLIAAFPSIGQQPVTNGADTRSISDAAGRCAGINGAGITFDIRRHNPATEAVKGKPALPAHCELIGSIDRRTGTDGQDYAIRFHLRLPDNWNRRFFFQGGGGSNGVVGEALGILQGDQVDVALARGYAVVSQDSGHDNDRNIRADHGGILSFGWDREARENYAYASLGRVTNTAKALIARYYGDAPVYSYFVGCSKGGQEGMAMAEDFPTQFNGIIANAPGFALPRAALAQAFDTQILADLARRHGHLSAGGMPLLGDSLSDADLGIVAEAVVKSCDALDGLADGIVGAARQCTARRVQTELNKRLCTTDGQSGCLSKDKIAAVTKIMAGGRTESGQPIYSNWPWDPGLGGTSTTLWGAKSYDGWRGWKLGRAGTGTNDARNILLGAASFASVFTTPPTQVTDSADMLLRYQLALNLDQGLAATQATSAGFSRSAWSIMAKNSVNRDAFSAAGGRMIIVHGAADPVFSLFDTMTWWDALNTRYKGKAAAFTRLFAVPGMNHCRGGPGTSQFDAFTALVDWVEKGKAPDRIIATAPAATPWPGRQRPLCPHPQIARYDGKGPIDSADSFRCTAR